MAWLPCCLRPRRGRAGGEELKIPGDRTKVQQHEPETRVVNASIMLVCGVRCLGSCFGKQEEEGVAAARRLSCRGKRQERGPWRWRSSRRGRADGRRGPAWQAHSHPQRFGDRRCGDSAVPTMVTAWEG